MLFWLLSSQSLAHAGDSTAWVSIYRSAGGTHAVAPKYKDPTPQGIFEKLTLPIKRANNLIIIEARVDSMEGNFVLDLGAPYLVLNQTYFRQYEKDYSRISGSINSLGATTLMTKVGRLELLDLFYEGVQADVMNLAAIENRRGIKILGLLGVNLFKNLEVEIDLQNNRLVLYRLDENGNRRLREDAQVVAPDLHIDVDVYNNVILLKGELVGRSMRFSLDTGAEVNVLDSRLPGKVFQAFTIDRRMMLRGVDGRAVEVLAGHIEAVTFDNVTLHQMKGIITNLENMSASYGIRIDGMLGYEFISQGKVSVNMVRKELQMHLYK